MKNIVVLLTLGLMLFPLAAADKKGATDKKTEPAEKKASDSEKPSEKAVNAVKALTSSSKTKLMQILNEGDDKSVQSLPGIGPVTAAAIIKGRPFADILDVLKVDGIGEGVLVKMVAHAKAGFPEKESKQDAKKPASGAMEEGKSKKSPKSDSVKKKAEPTE